MAATTEVREQVVMTPKCKTENSTTLIIERRAVEQPNEKMHVAGGDHTGIVINKETVIRKSSSHLFLCHVRIFFRGNLEKFVISISVYFH